jgi:hypothetical protein
MARKSTIDTLPPDILEQLQALLRDPRCTQLDITARINELLEAGGHEERISKSAVNRYAVRMEQVGAKIRQGREIAQMWVGQLGNAPQGQLGSLVNELIRNLAFEAALNFAEGNDPIPPKALKELAIAAEKLELAASRNEERERKIEAEARKKALEEAAVMAESGAKKAGLSADAVEQLRREILGIAA